MVPKATKQFLDYVIKNSEAGFAGLLNSASKPRLVDATKVNGVSFLYRLVPYVCKEASKAEGGESATKFRLPVSTAMVCIHCDFYAMHS